MRRRNCWRLSSRLANGCCWALKWLGRTWRAVSPRYAINAGRVPGPRILASGRKLETHGETYVQDLNPALADAILQQEFLLFDGADSARQAVRQNVFHNVDVIKITAEANLTVPELAAAIEEAHRNHLKLAVPAIEKPS